MAAGRSDAPSLRRWSRARCRATCFAARRRSAAGSRGLAARRALWPTPPIRGLPADWRASSGAPPSKGFRRPTALVHGRTLVQSLKLGRGRWAISLQYHSAEPLQVRGEGLDVRLPSNSQRMGSFWPVGTITLRKPAAATFSVRLASRSGPRLPRSPIGSAPGRRASSRASARPRSAGPVRTCRYVGPAAGSSTGTGSPDRFSAEPFCDQVPFSRPSPRASTPVTSPTATEAAAAR